MGRAPCCSKVGLNRGPWTPEEDMLLSKYIEAHGEGNWRALPKAAGLLRCGKSCRLRWVNYLRPNVKRGNISEDEEDLIIMLHALLGNRWSLIAARMPGRTDNEIKNYWNTHLSKKLASRGLDPKTHKPINNNKSNSVKKAEEESRDGDDHPQEAWETTMDFDTSSYSTGSCDDDDGQRRIQTKLSSRLISKRRHTLPPPVLKVTELKKKQSIGSQLAEKNSSSEQNVEKVINQPNKFDCASPSSVLNIHSPAPSSSNSGSNCDSPGSSSQRIPTSSSEQSRNSFTSNVQVSANRDAPAPAFMDWEQMQGQHQMLEFIDDFLCNKEDDHHMEGDLFKEDGGAEFWDTLGKIEMPMPQSDLWDGLNDLMPNQAVCSSGATPSQHFTHIGNSDTMQVQATHLPLINPSSSLPSTPFLQDNISELLFCA